MKELQSKLIKAKIELMGRSAFISTIALSAKHTITDTVPTAAVHKIHIMYNPQFIEKLTSNELAAVMAHECWHIAFQHASRRGSRIPNIWNAAADFIINHMLNRTGFQLPADCLIDNKYDEEWSTDAVYDDLLKNNTSFVNNMEDLSEKEGSEEIQIDSAVTQTIIRAKTQARIAGDKSIGHLPGEITRMIEELLNPRLPWPVILNRFLDQKTKEEYSWARRNRRYRDAYMPSLHSHGLGHLTFAIDTSGSVSDEELREMLSEIRGIQQVFNPQKMTIIDCDSRIHAVHDVDANTDILSLEFTGNGGTSFLPVLDYVNDHPTQALVYFTDLYGETDLEPVDYPVLWICNSKHPEANIGETIYVD